MAFIVGNLTKAKQRELKRRGWEVEEVDYDLTDELRRSCAAAVFVDVDMFKVMDGPDWDKGDTGASVPRKQKRIGKGNRPKKNSKG